MFDSNEDITQTLLAAIELELQQSVLQAKDNGTVRLYKMLAYHMGWQGKPIKNEARGKRIRPLLVLLTCSAAGGDWKQALPAAAAVEMVHNFSLIHDDIEDHSPLRRGRQTIWKRWGIAQAINTGDAMFTLAHLQAIRLKNTVSQHAALRAVEVLQQACLHLTQGQYLDLAFEKRENVSIDDYWNMVDGKTAALISACTEIGAISADCDEETCAAYRNFGRLFGLAFQVQDDILGIWGDTQITGKSNLSDLITKKKTLPILFTLSKNGKFAKRWNQGPIYLQEIDEIIQLLENEGGKAYSETESIRLIDKALNALDKTHPVNDFGLILRNLTLSLGYRKL